MQKAAFDHQGDVYGKGHPCVADAANTYAEILRALGRTEEADAIVATYDRGPASAPSATRSLPTSLPAD